MFVNASGIPANFVAPGDYTFWSLLNEVISEEPPDGSDPTTLILRLYGPLEPWFNQTWRSGEIELQD